MIHHIINSLNDESFGATAGTIQHEFKTKKPINGIIATMHFVQNGATLPTIAHMTTQFATEMTVKSGGTNAFALGGADWQALLNLGMPMRIAVHQSDGTGADNHVMSVSMPIPLAPFRRGLPIHPEFGLKPELDTVSVSLDFPADANNIDGRYLYLDYVTIDGSNPDKYIERLTRNYTAGATGWGHYIDLSYGSGISLYDIFLFMTTGLTAGTTTDATSIEQLSLELNNVEKYLVKVNADSLQFNLGNLSNAATSPLESSTYLYYTPNALGEFEDSWPLDERARVHYDAGVADAIRFCGGLIKPL